MKVVLILVASLLIFTGFALSGPKGEPKSFSQQNTVRLVRIQLEGLRPASVDHATTTIQNFPGVVDVKINEGSKEAVVHFDVERTNLRKLDQSLRRAGFTPWIH